MANEKIVKTLNEVLPRESIIEPKYVYSDSGGYVIEPLADGKYLITNDQGESFTGWYDLSDGLFHLQSNGFEWVYDETTGIYEVYDQESGRCVDPSMTEFTDGYYSYEPDSESSPQEQSVAGWFAYTAEDSTPDPAPTTERAISKDEEPSETEPVKHESPSKPKSVDLTLDDAKPASHTSSPSLSSDKEHSSVTSPVVSITDTQETIAVQSSAPVSQPDSAGAQHVSFVRAEVVLPETAGSDNASSPSATLVLGAAIYNAEGDESITELAHQIDYPVIVNVQEDIETEPVVVSQSTAQSDERSAIELPEFAIGSEENLNAADEPSNKDVTRRSANGHGDESVSETVRTSAARQNPFDVECALTESTEEFRFIGWPMIPVATAEGIPVFAAAIHSGQRDYQIQHVARNGDPRDQNGNSDEGGNRRDQENSQQDEPEEAQA